MQKSHSQRRSAPAAAKNEEALVNKAAMARLLGTTETTLNRWIARHGDSFPIAARGGRGVAWKFSPAEVIAFVERQRQAEADSDAASLPGQLQEARLRRLILANRKVESNLVDAGEVMRLASLAVAEMRAGTADFFTRIGQDLGWGADMTASVIGRADQIFTRGLAPVESALAPHGSTPMSGGPYDV